MQCIRNNPLHDVPMWKRKGTNIGFSKIAMNISKIDKKSIIEFFMYENWGNVMTKRQISMKFCLETFILMILCKFGANRLI